MSKADQPSINISTAFLGESLFPQQSIIAAALDQEREVGGEPTEDDPVPVLPKVLQAEQHEGGRSRRRNTSRGGVEEEVLSVGITWQFGTNSVPETTGEAAAEEQVAGRFLNLVADGAGRLILGEDGFPAKRAPSLDPTSREEPPEELDLGGGMAAPDVLRVGSHDATIHAELVERRGGEHAFRAAAEGKVPLIIGSRAQRDVGDLREQPLPLHSSDSREARGEACV